jgi:pseudouridine synthase
MEKIRLDRFLADRGIATRKDLKDWIRKGRVSVNGTPQRDSGMHVVPGKDLVELDGKRIVWKRFSYYMMYKPQGVITATEDKKLPTVSDLLPSEVQRTGVFPVGRLDRDTEGLLLFTNDGMLAHDLLSPKKHVAKVYEAFLSVEPVQGAERRFRKGLVLADGTRCLPAVLERLGVLNVESNHENEAADIEAENIEVENIEVENIEVENIEVENIEVENIEVENIQVECIEVECIEVECIEVECIEVECIEVNGNDNQPIEGVEDDVDIIVLEETENDNEDNDENDENDENDIENCGKYETEEDAEGDVEEDAEEDVEVDADGDAEVDAEVDADGDAEEDSEDEMLDLSKAFRVKVTIVEGKFHQVKRMIAAVGSRVLHLKRLQMGTLKLDDTMKPGDFRELTEDERKSLGAVD